MAERPLLSPKEEAILARFSLGCYTIRLRDKHSKTYRRLDDVGGGKDLLMVLREYLQSRTASYAINTDTQKLLRVLSFQPQDRLVSGIVETGEYGYEADLYDVNAAAVSYQRSRHDAEMVPFYFLANIPAQRDEGLLILQRRAQYGIRTVLLQDFRKYFEMLSPQMLIEINPIIPQGFIDQYLRDGRIKKVRFVRFEIPSDITDAYEGGGHTEVPGYAELAISAGRDQSLPLLGRIQDVLDGRRSVNDLIELHEFDYDTVKVEMEFAGSRKTVDLSNVMKLRAYVDITSELEVGLDGHPVLASVDRIATDLMNSVLVTLGTGGLDAI